MSAEILLTVEEAASRLKISKHTLNRWRVTSEGPPFIKYGPRLVRHTDRVLDEWAAGAHTAPPANMGGDRRRQRASCSAHASTLRLGSSPFGF